MKTLHTERLLLRAYEERDAADMYAYAKNPNVGPAAGWKPHESLEESQAICKSFVVSDEVWAIVLKETGRVIGSVGLHREKRRDHENIRSLGYVLSEDYWGRGLMVEASRALLQHAFVDMRLDLVCVGHFPFNAQSRRVIEKCGFTYEGTLRMASRIYTGEVHDICYYSMTRDEYLG